MQQNFDAFVAANAAALDAEVATGPMMSHAEGSVGSRFTDIMKQIWTALGGVPWSKWFAVANAVILGIQGGKSISEIVADVLAAWQKGSI